MKTVNRFEAHLLRLLQAILQRTPVRSSLPIVHKAIARPECLSRTAIELIQDSLRKGCVQLLAKRDGWQRRRHLRNGQPQEGRLWERTSPAELGFTFSRHSLAFLVWTTGVEFEKPEVPLRLNQAELTIGDQWLLFLAYDAFRETDVGVKMRSYSPWATNALCWLMYPEEATEPPTDPTCDFRPWATGQGACVLEALQSRLAARWVYVEQSKTRLRNAETMQRLGDVQRGVLERFHRAIEATQRRDLAAFELAALNELTRGDAVATNWVGGLDVRGLRMADRQNVQRAACSFLEQVDHLRRWEREARGVSYFDEDYATAQFWQSLWERQDGDALLARTHALIREIEPLHA